MKKIFAAILGFFAKRTSKEEIAKVTAEVIKDGKVEIGETIEAVADILDKDTE